VKAGDTLPLMCYMIYGDPKYYLAVAAANNLSNFRSLLPGTDIVFPPLEKVNNMK
jgi:nucleoid-associated protein YgaU